MALEVKDRPLTRAEFCEFAQISYGLYHKLVRNGDSPRVTRIGALVRIMPQHAAEWLESRVQS